MTSEHAPLTVWIPEALNVPEVTQAAGASVTRKAPARLERVGQIIVVSDLDTLPVVAPFVRAANDAQKLKGLLLWVQEGELPAVMPRLAEAELNVRKHLLLFSHPGVARRVVEAVRAGAEEHLMATALVRGDRLWVIDCALRKWELPISEIRELRRWSRSRVAEVRVDEDGAVLTWPDSDVFLTLDTIIEAVEPAVREKARLEGEQFDSAYGQAIRELRLELGRTQDDMPISSRQMRRIESGARPRLATLRRLAAVHGMPTGDYLDALAERSARIREGERADPGRRASS